MDWLNLLTVQRTLKTLLHSSKVSILRCSAYFIVQISHPSMTTGETITLTRRTFVDKVMPLLFKMLSGNLLRLLAIIFYISLNYYQVIKLIKSPTITKKISHSFLCVLASFFCKRFFFNAPFLAD